MLPASSQRAYTDARRYDDVCLCRVAPGRAALITPMLALDTVDGFRLISACCRRRTMLLTTRDSDLLDA